MSRRITAVTLAVVSALLLAGCSTDLGSSPQALTNDSSTLRILAGSELKDMVPLLADAAAETGVKVAFEYTGTLDGTQKVASGGAAGQYDATWFPNNKYLSLLPGAAKATATSVPVMSSPVALGLQKPVAAALGWDKTAPTWSEIAAAASDGRLTYGMTNPSASNSGFSALVSVATALSGTGTALSDADITTVTPALTTFFGGQKLTAGSSGWLADQFTTHPDKVDGIINYESVLMGLNTQGSDLAIVTPSDGVVTSDYPLTLLTSADPAKKALFDKLSAWLTSPKTQQRIVADTHRRPGVAGVDTGTTFPSGLLFETPFPNTLDVANSLISAYLNVARAPAQTIFVLDTSGSMQGDRMVALQTALKSLAGTDTSTSGSFAAFRSRERVTLLPFSSHPGTPKTIDMPDTDKAAEYTSIRRYADDLNADGGTAIYDSVTEAYKIALKQKAERPGTFISIVLMTDGENTEGSTANQFENRFKQIGENAIGIPTFVVQFGNGDPAELKGIADLTGGQIFDASNGDLTRAFREIRGYQ